MSPRRLVTDAETPENVWWHKSQIAALMSVGAVIFALLACVTKWSWATLANPGLQFERQQCDLGVIGTDQIVRHAVAFRNQSNLPVCIRQISVDCGCIAHKLNKETYAPGEDGQLSIELNTSGIPGLTSFEKHIAVRYSIQDKEHVTFLTVVGRVGVDLRLSSETISLSDTVTGELRGEICVKRGTLSRREFRAVQVSCPRGSVDTRARATDVDTINVQVTAGTDSPLDDSEHIVLNYIRGGRPYAKRVPLRRRSGQLRWTTQPTCFLAVVSSNDLSDAVRRQSRRRVRIDCGKDRRVTIAEVRSRDSNSLICTELDVECSNAIAVWLDQVPFKHGVWRTELELICLVEGEAGPVTVQLPCYVSVDPGLQPGRDRDSRSRLRFAPPIGGQQKLHAAESRTYNYRVGHDDMHFKSLGSSTFDETINFRTPPTMGDRAEEHVDELSGSSIRLLQDLEEADAWNNIIGVYASIVYRRCRNGGLCVQDAEDVTQDVFTSIARSIERFERRVGGSSFDRWINVITTNKLRDYWRRVFKSPQAPGGTSWHKRIEKVEDQLDESITYDVSYEDSRLDQIAAARAVCSERDWAIFERLVIDDRSAAEVAEEFSVTANVVYLVRSRILSRIRSGVRDETT